MTSRISSKMNSPAISGFSGSCFTTPIFSFRARAASARRGSVFCRISIVCTARRNRVSESARVAAFSSSVIRKVKP